MRTSVLVASLCPRMPRCRLDAAAVGGRERLVAFAAALLLLVDAGSANAQRPHAGLALEQLRSLGTFKLPKQATDGEARGRELQLRLQDSAGAEAEGDGSGGGNSCPMCQDGTIRCDQTVFGRLAALDCMLDVDGSFFDTWRFDVATPREIDILYTSFDFDTYLFLTDFNCVILDFNDDCTPGNLNVSCLTAQLQAGTYYLICNSYDQGEIGAYELQVSCAGVVPQCTNCLVSPVNCHRTVEGFLSRGGCQAADGAYIDIHPFRLPVPTPVDVKLTSKFFNPSLLFFGFDCSVLELNDDCTLGDLRTSCLTVNLAAGDYFIGVSSPTPGATGAYTLEVSCGVSACTLCDLGAVSCDETITREYPATLCSQLDPFSFEIEESTEVTITHESQAFDPVLRLLDANCNEIASNDDCEEGSSSSCLTAELEPGLYHIGVSSSHLLATGTFTLSVGCGSEDRQVPGDCDQNGSLEISDAVCLLGTLFRGSPEVLPCGDGSFDDPANSDLLNFNGDASVNLTDAVNVLLYLFRAGPPHFLGTECVVIPGCPNACRD